MGSASPCAAQQLRLHGYVAGAHALIGDQKSELGFGGTARASVEWVIIREFGVVLQGSGIYLSAGDKPKDKTLASLGAASDLGATIGVHYRPFATKTYGKVVSPAGLWLGGSFGLAYTNDTFRPLMDTGVGFDFLFRKATVGLGPMLGWEHVFQPNDQVRPADANILFAGIHGMLELGAQKGTVDGDQDEDGIRDSLDKCPTEPEDKDHFEDSDGCPDLDNDKDGVLDSVDRCPNEAEDRDGFQDEDGCPDADNDQDGFIDLVDQCPNEPEDKDGFQDTDGCPDLDNDKDGIPDKEDLCPNEPETVNGYADHDGCPDANQIRVMGDKIVLDDRVYFMMNSHEIRSMSFALLERLAKLIKEHPEYVHIEIQGHTDERGPAEYNQKLSQDRADAVMEFLVKNGVKADRLTAKGFGQTKPLVAERTDAAYEMNRRVEIEITREIKQPNPTAPVDKSKTQSPP